MRTQTISVILFQQLKQFRFKVLDLLGSLLLTREVYMQQRKPSAAVRATIQIRIYQGP